MAWILLSNISIWKQNISQKYRSGVSCVIVDTEINTRSGGISANKRTAGMGGWLSTVNDLRVLSVSTSKYWNHVLFYCHQVKSFALVWNLKFVWCDIFTFSSWITSTYYIHWHFTFYIPQWRLMTLISLSIHRYLFAFCFLNILGSKETVGLDYLQVTWTWSLFD